MCHVPGTPYIRRHVEPSGGCLRHARGSHIAQAAARSNHMLTMVFFNKKLEPAQQKCSAFDRDLFAVYSVILHFWHMLEGRKLTVRTDDEPLSLTLTIPRVSDPWTARQCRHLAFMAEYISSIQYIASSKYIVADRLSQPPGHMQGPHTQL